MKTQETVKIQITGVSGYIQHNGRLADESDLLTIARKERQNTYKKKPTTQNWEEFVTSMMMGGMYFSEELGVYLPEDCLRAMLVKAGASIKMKGNTTYKSAMASALNFENYGFSILVDGKPLMNAEKFAAEKKFRFEKIVTIGKAKVRSVRPILPRGWQAEVVITYLPSLVDEDVIVDVFGIAGLEVGIGDWRPSAPKPGPFGRFIISAVNGKDVK